jgi:DNA-binding CsgD family transcriptional regulator
LKSDIRHTLRRENGYRSAAYSAKDKTDTAACLEPRWGNKTMEAHVQGSAENQDWVHENDVLAHFTIDQCTVRVARATHDNCNESLGKFCLNGVCYVLLISPAASKAMTVLTRREREVASQIARGFGTKQIAHNLGISPHTALTYVTRMRTKLGVRNRPEIVAALLKS